MIVVVGVVVIAHVEIVVGVLVRVVRVPTLTIVGRLSFLCIKPCFLRGPYIVPLDLGVTLRL